MEVKLGYKQSEVGVIPEDWKVRPLYSLGGRGRPVIKAGPFGSSLTKDTYVKGGYKIYGQEQVIRGDYSYGDYFISPARFNELRSCSVEPGDVLLSLVGTAGRILVVPEGAPEGIINPRLVRFSFDRNVIYPYYFKYLLESKAYQALLARNAQVGTMGVLNVGMLKTILIPVPSLPEQSAIVSALNNIDSLINSLEKLIAKKRNIEHGAMQQLLTGKKDCRYPEGKTAHHVSTALNWVRQKQLAMIPARLAIAMQERGWILRNDIIWHKTNGLPASVKDRLNNRYEHVFHFVKSEKYYYNLEVIREAYKGSSIKRFSRLILEGFKRTDSKYNLHDSSISTQLSEGRTPVPNWVKGFTPGKSDPKKAEQLYRTMKGRIGHGHYKGGVYKGIQNHPIGKNPGDVWSLSTGSYRGAHFAVYPEKLCIKPVLSSSPLLVCKKCGTPKREVVNIPSAGAVFNIRVRDAQKGILAGKWGGKVNASEKEVKRYNEFFYKTNNRERVISEGCSCYAGFSSGTILDPFVGSGTTMKVALELGRNAIGIELNAKYVKLVESRIGTICKPRTFRI